MLQIKDKVMSFSGDDKELVDDIVHCVDIVMAELYHRDFEDLSYLSLSLIESLEKFVGNLDIDDNDNEPSIIN